MAFYRRNKNDNERGHYSFGVRKEHFHVSEKSFRRANIASSLTITVFVFILFIVKSVFVISESDIQTICEIAAGLSAFAIAIPLFLKDFDIASTFWKQFYLIAISFLLTTFIGVFAFLQIDDNEHNSIVFHLCFFASIFFSINVNNLAHLGKKINLRISLNPIVNLSISYILLFVSLFLFNGDIFIYATILFAIFGFYLILTLMLSVLLELLFHKPIESNELRIKKAIQRLVERYKERAFDEQTLLDKLKSEEFPDEQDIVSRTKIQDLISEMDSAIDDNEPKITIYEYDRIIPRWKKEYEDILEKSLPVFLLFRRAYPTNITEKEFDIIIDDLANNIGLSSALLKENHIIPKKYHLVEANITFKEFGEQKWLCLLAVGYNVTSINKSNCFICSMSSIFTSLFNKTYRTEELLSEYFSISIISENELKVIKC